MPVSSNSNTSMFPAFDYDYSADEEYCYNSYHVIPRPTWITTEFGGHVRQLFVQLLYAYESISNCISNMD